jgi:hypothetical protein
MVVTETATLRQDRHLRMDPAQGRDDTEYEERTVAKAGRSQRKSTVIENNKCFPHSA